ncbi:hypothetical protein TRVA0_085S00122 [Trichomonascus vanleenenianus]|uniref:uncharacterized protein n=1 Tax=Trichomonascus vanleenenianus TaxID=2268995 RepID=UPI003ECACAA7
MSATEDKARESTAPIDESPSVDWDQSLSVDSKMEVESPSAESKMEVESPSAKSKLRSVEPSMAASSGVDSDVEMTGDKENPGSSEEEQVSLRRSKRKRRQTTFEEFAADESLEKEEEPKKKPVKLRLTVPAAHSKKPQPKTQPKPPPKKAKAILEPEDVPWLADSELTNQQPEADEDIPANSPSIAQIVLFQEQFPSLFEGIPRLGPQDIERGVQVSEGFSPEVEALFCRLLTLVLNRKKPVENGKYLRALEELQALLPSLGVSEAWPRHMKLKAKYKTDVIIPLSWQHRVEVLRMLTLWTVANNEQAKAIVNETRSRPAMHGALDRFFKEEKGEDDLEENGGEEVLEGVDVGPIGMDSERRRYFFVQGYGDTEFRLYRTTNPYLRYFSWKSVASTADGIEQLITQGALAEDSSEDAQKLREKLGRVLPLLRESESRRYKVLVKEEKKRQQIEELAQVRSGEGRYAGRTRGRRINYNVDDFDFGEEEDDTGAVNDGEEFNPDDDDVDEEDINAGIARGAGVRQSARLRGKAASGIEIGDNDIPVGEHGQRMVVVLKLPKNRPVPSAFSVAQQYPATQGVQYSATQGTSQYPATQEIPQYPAPVPQGYWPDGQQQQGIGYQQPQVPASQPVPPVQVVGYAQPAITSQPIQPVHAAGYSQPPVTSQLPSSQSVHLSVTSGPASRAVQQQPMQSGLPAQQQPGQAFGYSQPPPIQSQTVPQSPPQPINAVTQLSQNGSRPQVGNGHLSHPSNSPNPSSSPNPTKPALPPFSDKPKSDSIMTSQESRP